MVKQSQFRELTAPAIASLASAREILKREAALIALPFGQIKYESRRKGTFLECTFSYNDEKLCACAVSSQGLNRQCWDEFVSHFSRLQDSNEVSGPSGNTLKAPEHSPWMASFVYGGIGLIKKSEWPHLIILMQSLSFAFMIDSATDSPADSGSGSR